MARRKAAHVTTVQDVARMDAAHAAADRPMDDPAREQAAQDIATAIQANVAAYVSGQRPYGEFGALAKVQWDRAVAGGKDFHARVTALVRANVGWGKKVG